MGKRLRKSAGGFSSQVGVWSSSPVTINPKQIKPWRFPETPWTALPLYRSHDLAGEVSAASLLGHSKMTSGRQKMMRKSQKARLAREGLEMLRM